MTFAQKTWSLKRQKSFFNKNKFKKLPVDQPSTYNVFFFNPTFELPSLPLSTLPTSNTCDKRTKLLWSICFIAFLPWVISFLFPTRLPTVVKNRKIKQFARDTCCRRRKGRRWNLPLQRDPFECIHW